MGYQTNINFTLDTICPWTYIAKKRLDLARQKVKEDHPDATFHLHIYPYQLHADAPESGEDKYAWYLNNKHDSDETQMKKYTTVMTHLGHENGINFKFGGTIASTLNAHRVIQWVQEKYGEEKAETLVNALYRMYFEEEKHPSSQETLREAMKEVGLDGREVEEMIGDEREGLQDVKMLIREQAQNGVDAVPNITFEGRRRDLTLVGAKEVDEYVKTLEQILKESK